MKNSIKNSVVGFLIGIVLVASMGFSVNTLYCFCMGQYEVSFFDIEHQCAKQHVEEETHACCKKLKAHCSKPTKPDHDCAKKNKKFFKADLKFTELSKIELPKQPLFIVFSTFNTPHYTYSFSKIIPFQAQIPTRPPPQYFGRQLLNFIQVYRC